LFIKKLPKTQKNLPLRFISAIGAKTDRKDQKASKSKSLTSSSGEMWGTVPIRVGKVPMEAITEKIISLKLKLRAKR